MSKFIAMVAYIPGPIFLGFEFRGIKLLTFDTVLHAYADRVALLQSYQICTGAGGTR